MKATLTGWAAANYKLTDTHESQYCGPIRDTENEAWKDAALYEYDGVRFVSPGGKLWVNPMQVR